MASPLKTLPGFRDFYPVDCAARNYVFDIWRRVANRYGFVEYEGPILEPTDLYRRKSGDEIVDQLFNFTDKGDRDVSMRPELTPTLARMAAARQRDFRKPLRWFSIGQFFRYERHQKGRGREFYQFNCDILGEDSVLADAELIALSIDLMKELGFTESDFRIRLSDRNAWINFATTQRIKEESWPAFLQVIDKMERAPEDKTDSLLSELGTSLGEVQAFMKSGPSASNDLKTILNQLDARGMTPFIKVDLGIVRGLAYYTGPVFEVFDIRKSMRAIAGGGRYDQLVKLIGGVDLTACGFAMGDMVITDLIRETEGPATALNSSISDSEAIDVYVVIADPERQGDAAAVTQALRDAGKRTILPLSPSKVGKQFQAAEQSGAKQAVVVGSEFPALIVKTLSDRSETECDLQSLLDYV
ncbi:MAG: histidine--tRNA ligase [Verrucomicrobiota bacterium]